MSTLLDHLNFSQYVTETCHCGLKVGDPCTVDGFRGRGIVTRRNGRRLTVEFRSDLSVTRDQSFIHKLGNSPGEV